LENKFEIVLSVLWCIFS